MSHTLILGSKSQPRQWLLKEAGIPFELAGQDADEAKCDWTLPLEQVVEQIALFKMDHVIMPSKTEQNIRFVVTADTLSQDMAGNISGKPVDRNDAIKKIKAAREGARLSTAFCLDKKRWDAGVWVTQERVVQVVTSEYEFNIPDEWIDWYLDNSTGLACSNAIAVEGLGSSFLRSVRGSYSNIIGLPLFELRQELTRFGFFV